ncbi:putative peptide modification system cyclase [Stenotrophomonas sp. Betaine-02u-21]|uniref:putative peptide modification system cyclase n=1 Tax=unclassified Stenotrophomonas TaxID=196198 RepID=UPI000C322269|nr:MULTISPECIES: putative peptide modification system cyclase [unclassified Stenotrophomonas]PKH73739.1 putative peptide modification system cyclase [Stenotrophomonas sp. Betaine-02u-23]PKH75596.1 putative peptide modification system cyclase [Stenotrophomonas sp. Betaine-02u-21]PKH97741.1 putative peptide modification system cyclase [Stenotrophomonas sp. Bg11-02]
MNGGTEATSHVPQLRALLFTDLCDSTTLVERIGDAAAAELFQQHDRLVLAMQQRWRGQQIDRSDGLFVLFERPVDALGFALDYQQALRQLGQANKVPLLARAGLHVGEVILWNNSAEAIALGSKPVEVEGLAKPMAARLMQLARPGQVLLSATAESMVRRVADSLGEVGKGLKWKSFGRWRFKGVAQPMDVYGVVSEDVPAVGRPRPTPKAIRDIPFWRRPMAMAAEAMFAVMLVLGGWLLLRPQPAIAFAERDWVVLADVRNMTGNSLLDDSMDLALRVSLEQSRYVNVLSDLKVRDTEARMRRNPDAPLDRKAAVEVAIREGARAVLIPSIAEVNGRLRVAVEVVQPRDGVTVFTEYADGRGLESALRSTDTVVASLRTRLGEALSDVHSNARPLPQVITPDLDALRAYAEGSNALADRRYSEALQFFEQALKLDPEFAFAHVGRMRIHMARGEVNQAMASYRSAVALRERLPPRDVLYLEAWGKQLDGAPISEVAAKWKMLTDLYPDYYAGYMNRARALYSLGDYTNALNAARRLLATQNPMRSVAHDFVGRIELAIGRHDTARRHFRTANTLAGRTASTRLGIVYAVEGDMPAALANIKDVQPSNMGQQLERAAVLVDANDASSAIAGLQTLRDGCGEEVMCTLVDVVVKNLQGISGVQHRGYRQDILKLLHELDGEVAVPDQQEVAFIVAATAYVAQRGDHSPGNLLPLIKRQIAARGGDRSAQMLVIVEATQARLDGHPERALAMLKPMVDGRELYQVHAALRDAYLAMDDAASARVEQKWLARHRGLAYAEDNGNYILQALNVRDSHDPRGQPARGPAALAVAAQPSNASWTLPASKQ